MAYSKANLKSSGDRASPRLRPLLIGNLSDTFLPTRTLLYVSVRLRQISTENQNTHFIFSNFSQILRRLEDTVEECGRKRQAAYNNIIRLSLFAV